MVPHLDLGIGAFAPCHAAGSGRQTLGNQKMKKLATALAAIAAFTAPAFAADMPVRTPVSVPAPVAYAPSRTGCYIGGGGGGYGLWNQENTGFIDGPPRVQFTSTTTAGGRGFFGTVGGGCDYQFGLAGLNLVAGAFVVYDWGSVKGHLNPAAALALGGRVEMRCGLCW